MDFHSGHSLTYATMLSMGIRISVVITVVALLSYQHITNSLEQQLREELKQYIAERSARESQIFELAEAHHKTFKATFSELWETRKNSPSKQRFHQLFQANESGVYRLESASFEGLDKPHRNETDYLGKTRWITGFIGKNAPVEDSNFQNRVLLAYDLVDYFAVGWSNYFANTYASLPEGVNIVYWPELNWAEGASDDLDIPSEEWVYIANKENNPERKSVWTGLYYDPSADSWMVSCETPVDSIEGQHLVNAGHDILLDKLFERVFEDRIPGTFNYIFRADGRLIAHPHYTEDLEATLGLLNINDIDNASLIQQYQLMMAAAEKDGANPQVLEATMSSGETAFLAFAPISGPSWFFVTVYPQSLLSSTAKSSAEFIFILGVLSLVVELLVLYLVLRKKVITPLAGFKSAITAIGENNFHIKPIMSAMLSSKKRKDEIGQLGDAFVEMAEKLRYYQLFLEDEVKKRTEEAEDARQKAEERARTDSLTELPNRRAFFEFAEFSFAQAKRYNSALCIIMVDIDFFKKVNDHFGHAAGDVVLKCIAQILKKSLRPTDVVARIGGEEFVVLLNNCNAESGIKVAEKLRKLIAEKNITMDDVSMKVTASFGVAQYGPTFKDFDELLAQSDKALYQAKQLGRNRVESQLVRKPFDPLSNL